MHRCVPPLVDEQVSVRYSGRRGLSLEKKPTKENSDEWGKLLGHHDNKLKKERKKTHPLLIKPALCIQILKQPLILTTPKEIQVGNLKITPVMAQAPDVAVPIMHRTPAHPAAEGVREPAGLHHGRPQAASRRRGDPLALLPVGNVAEQRWARVGFLPEANSPTVDFAAAGHLGKGVVGDGAGEVNAWFEAPVPLVRCQGLVGVEFSRIGG